MANEPEVFDVVVVGAGPAGETVAERLARAGLTVAVVEERLIGGECNYYGCIPSKAMLWPMDIAADVRRMPGLGLRGPIDAAAVVARREEFVSHFDDSGFVSWVEGLPATFVRGRGRLAGRSQVEVRTPDGGTRPLRARRAVVLATGTTPAIPDIPGLREAKPWTNQEATSSREVPERLVVVGAGPVGCEMAQALHSLGARETTMLVRGDRLLPRTEPMAGDLVAKSFAEVGIDVRFGRSAVRVERPVPGGPVTVHTSDGERIDADEILVAIGRSDVHDLGLETVGLDADGPITVDATMRAAGVPDGWLYAVGDVNGRNLLTHMGKYQARVCADAITARAGGLESDIADARGAPQVIFTDPQVCAVGRTEARAQEDGFAVHAVEYDIGAVVGAKLRSDGYQGWAKLVVDADRHVLLGATFVGPGVVDLLHSATIAVACEARINQLRHAVPVFPTVSEIWLELLMQYEL